jgi:hypothetical protein
LGNGSRAIRALIINQDDGELTGVILAEQRSQGQGQHICFIPRWNDGTNSRIGCQFRWGVGKLLIGTPKLTAPEQQS